MGGQRNHLTFRHITISSSALIFIAHSNLIDEAAPQRHQIDEFDPVSLSETAPVFLMISLKLFIMISPVLFRVNSSAKNENKMSITWSSSAMKLKHRARHRKAIPALQWVQLVGNDRLPLQLGSIARSEIA